MILVLTSVVFLFCSACFSFFGFQKKSLRTIVNLGGVIPAFILASTAAIYSLINGTSSAWSYPWPFFNGSITFEIAPLSSFFILIILILSLFTGIYGTGYIGQEKDIRTRFLWFSFNILVASMILVVTAKNVILFLLVWESMALSSFFLVIHDHHKSQVRAAGLIYFVLTHIGTLFVIVFFLLLSGNGSNLDFSSLTPPTEQWKLNLCFFCALIGFGTKAGLMPLHVWLPEAHPAAPSHVSALMSGVMIKMGIFGLYLAMTFLSPIPPSWSITLIVLGSVSGILGVLFALSQHDIKRLLAYHSIENIGIIVMGLGVGLYGLALGSNFIAILGISGSLLHTLNHGLFKSSLFLGAGAVIKATGKRDIEGQGGLIKKMPSTSLSFLVSSISICGIPPFNGFISEFFIYSAAFVGLIQFKSFAVIPFLGVILSLALIGGLALYCFTKLFGIVFLGEPRHAKNDLLRDPPGSMLVPIIILPILCSAIGLLPWILFKLMGHVLPDFLGIEETLFFQNFLPIETLLIWLSVFLFCFYLLLGALFLARKKVFGKKTIKESLTWDCGFAQPTPRMQYTASSFASPLIELMRPIFQFIREFHPLRPFFPAETVYHTNVSDLFVEKIYNPIENGVEHISRKMLKIQHGLLHLYVLYILIVLVVLLLWRPF